MQREHQRPHQLQQPLQHQQQQQQGSGQARPYGGQANAYGHSESYNHFSSRPLGESASGWRPYEHQGLGRPSGGAPANPQLFNQRRPSAQELNAPSPRPHYASPMSPTGSNAPSSSNEPQPLVLKLGGGRTASRFDVQEVRRHSPTPSASGSPAFANGSAASASSSAPAPASDAPRQPSVKQQQSAWLRDSPLIPLGRKNGFAEAQPLPPPSSPAAPSPVAAPAPAPAPAASKTMPLIPLGRKNGFAEAQPPPPPSSPVAPKASPSSSSKQTSQQHQQERPKPRKPSPVIMRERPVAQGPSGARDKNDPSRPLSFGRLPSFQKKAPQQSASPPRQTTALPAPQRHPVPVAPARVAPGSSTTTLHFTHPTPAAPLGASIVVPVASTSVASLTPAAPPKAPEPVAPPAAITPNGVSAGSSVNGMAQSVPPLKVEERESDNMDLETASSPPPLHPLDRPPPAPAAALSAPPALVIKTDSLETKAEPTPVAADPPLATNGRQREESSSLSPLESSVSPHHSHGEKRRDVDSTLHQSTSKSSRKRTDYSSGDSFGSSDEDAERANKLRKPDVQEKDDNASTSSASASDEEPPEFLAAQRLFIAEKRRLAQSLPPQLPEPVLSPSVAAVMATRPWEELEGINFATPQAFVAVAKQMTTARGMEVTVVDGSHKASRAYFHIACVRRSEGCPFILKLGPARGRGWLLRSEVDKAVMPTSRSVYRCKHREQRSSFPQPAVPPKAAKLAPAPAKAAQPPASMQSFTMSPGLTGLKPPLERSRLLESVLTPVLTRHAETALAHQKRSLDTIAISSRAVSAPVDAERALLDRLPAAPLVSSSQLPPQRAPPLAATQAPSSGPIRRNSVMARRTGKSVQAGASNGGAPGSQKAALASRYQASAVGPSQQAPAMYAAQGELSEHSAMTLDGVDARTAALHAPLSRSVGPGMVFGPPRPPSYHEWQAQQPDADVVREWTGFLELLDPVFSVYGVYLSLPSFGCRPSMLFNAVTPSRERNAASIARDAFFEQLDIPLWHKLRLTSLVKSCGNETWAAYNSCMDKDDDMPPEPFLTPPSIPIPLPSD